MDIVVTSTGKKFHGVDPLLGGILCEAFPEAIQRIAKPTFNVQEKPNPSTPRWAVQKNPWSDKLEICMTVLNRSVRYPGLDCVNPTVEEAAKVFKSAGYEVPAGILQEFAAVLRPGIDPDTLLESRLQAQNKQWAREQAEKLAERKANLRG